MMWSGSRNCKSSESRRSTVREPECFYWAAKNFGIVVVLGCASFLSPLPAKLGEVERAL
mgnify:CR=1 FL=1